jgi:hypothetical protein
VNDYYRMSIQIDPDVLVWRSRRPCRGCVLMKEPGVEKLWRGATTAPFIKAAPHDETLNQSRLMFHVYVNSVHNYLC